MNTAHRKSVIVIGAGTAGLTAAHFIHNSGIEVRILEQESRVGESWRRRHPQLSLNTHRQLSALPGILYASGTASFPKRDSVIAHLTEFAKILSVPIEYGVKVDKLEYLKGSWIIHSSSGKYSASDVVVATGRDKRPHMPQWKGSDKFRGSLIHAADFGVAQDYAAKRVLVVGAGNSGFDILNHLSRVKTREVWLSTRGGPSLLPKRIAGLAVHRLSPLMSLLPAWASDKIISMTQRLAFGDLTKLGLPAASKGGATRLANEHVALASDEGAIKALKAGRTKILPELKEFKSDGVIMVDGSTISPDIVIAATGYTPDLEEMVGSLEILGKKGFPSINGGQSLSHFPGLWFIGMRADITGDVYSAARQALEITREIENRAT